MKKVPCWLVLPLLLTLFGAGCWDRWEIEQRGFVLGLALDKGPGEAYRVTMQLVDPSSTVQGVAGGGEGGGAGQPVWNLTSTGSSVLKAIRSAASRSYRAPFLAFMQVLVVGEELARAGLTPPLDLFLRDVEFRHRVPVYIVQGEGARVLAVQPRLEPVSAVYLANLGENMWKTAHIAPQQDLGDLGAALYTKQPFILPLLLPADQEAHLEGAGVFSAQGRLVGWLGGEEVQAVRWLCDEISGGTVVVTAAGDGQEEVFEISGAKSRTRPRVDAEGRLSFVLDIQAEGVLAEKQQYRDDALDPRYMQQVEQAVAGEIAENVRRTVRRVQEDLGVDIFNWGQALERYNPRAWRAVAGQWQEVFPSVPVEVKVQVFIRRLGLHR